jgi:hypothetical protein
MFNNTDDFRQHFGRRYLNFIRKLGFCTENQYLNLQFAVIRSILLICLKSIFVKIL